MQPGNYYKASYSYNFFKVNFSLFIGFFLAIGVGRLYAIIVMHNPISFIHFAVLFFLIVVSAAFFSLALDHNKSKNTFVNVSFIFLLCSVAWMAQWAHIKCNFYNQIFIKNGEEQHRFWGSFFDFNSTINFIPTFAERRKLLLTNTGILSVNYFSTFSLYFFYIIEMLCFFAPLKIIFFNKKYYCKNCQKELAFSKGYANIASLVISNFEKTVNGDFRFLENIHFFATPVDSYAHSDDKQKTCFVTLYYCQYCTSNAILNVREGLLIKKEKRSTVFIREKYLIEDLYINDESKSFLKMSLW